MSNLQSQEDAWERASDKWKDEHEYYSHSDYEDSHPRPTRKYKLAFRSLVILLCVALAVFLAVGFAKEVAEKQKNKPKEAPAVVEGKNCQNFNKNDKVRIQYGDHVGNVGTIIGGCEANEQYQVKIDEGSKANVSDNNPEAVDVGGWTISVDDQDNLVVIDDKKEQ